MTLKSEAVASLKSYLERIERLEDERGELADDIRALYAEAKAEGFAPKAIRGIIKRRRAKNPQKLDDDETVLETYMHAVGMLPESPLAAAVSALAVDTLARDQVVDAFRQLVPRNGEIIAKVGGEPLRIWRDDDGQAHVEPWIEPKAKPSEKTGKALKKSATVLSIVPKDAVKAAADRAERRARGEPDPDDVETDAETDEPVT
jgi:uncharacterized protein (UPF0335 family)